MSTSERLEQFFPFDEAVLEQVSDAATWQNRFTFPQLAARYGIEDGPQVVPATHDHKAFEVLTLEPQGDYDPSQARLLHLGMSLPIDPNTTMRALRLFGADQSRQLIVTGSPAAAGQRYGKLRFQDMKKVWDGDLTPAVDPFLAYVHGLGVKRTEEVGFSYGADKAAASAMRAGAFDIAAERGVWMESASAVNRGPGLTGLARLGIDFISAGEELENYVAACASPPLREAREQADVGMPRYLLGLGRLSNLAIANALAHDGFEDRVRRALSMQPELKATVAWGTSSELADDAVMRALTERLRAAFGEERVNPLALENMHHIGCDDIDLHAAIVLQGLRSA